MTAAQSLGEKMEVRRRPETIPSREKTWSMDNSITSAVLFSSSSNHDDGRQYPSIVDLSLVEELDDFVLSLVGFIITLVLKELQIDGTGGTDDSESPAQGHRVWQEYLHYAIQTSAIGRFGASLTEYIYQLRRVFPKADLYNTMSLGLEAVGKAGKMQSLVVTQIPLAQTYLLRLPNLLAASIDVLFTRICKLFEQVQEEMDHIELDDSLGDVQLPYQLGGDRFFPSGSVRVGPLTPPTRPLHWLLEGAALGRTMPRSSSAMRNMLRIKKAMSFIGKSASFAYAIAFGLQRFLYLFDRTPFPHPMLQLTNTFFGEASNLGGA